MKSDQSLGDLKNTKFSKKKQLSNRIRIFFYSKLPYETRTRLFMYIRNTFCVLGIRY